MADDKKADGLFTVAARASPAAGDSRAASRASHSNGGSTADHDAAHLAQLGYRQEFKREIGFLANVGLSLTAIGVLTGMSSAFQSGLFSGGPLVLFWAWNIVSVFMFLIALSQAEICSAFPTMGGLYFWVCRLAPPRFAPLLGFVTGNLYTWGMVVTGVSGNLSVALYVAALVQVGSDGATSLRPWQVVAVAWGVNLLSGVLNVAGMRAIGQISRMNVWFTLIGTVVLVVTLFAASPAKNDASFAFFDFENFTGWDNSGLVFLLGFLQAVYSLQGSETSAQIAEEAQNAEWTAPVAIASSIAGSWLVGLVYLIALNFNIQSVDSIAGTAFALPIAQLFYDAVGRRLAILCLTVILVAQWAAALTAWTASSRLLFALARDSAFPGKRYFMALTRDTQSPYWGVWLSVAVGCALDLTYIGSPVAFNAILSFAAVGVLLAYTMPMLCRVLWPAHLNDANRGPFTLGRFSFAVNLLGTAFGIVMSVMLLFPTAYPVTPLNMNYAIVGISGVLLFIGLTYALWGRHVYHGPVRTVDMSQEDIDEVLGGGGAKQQA